jgi:hypothetical protein
MLQTRMEAWKDAKQQQWLQEGRQVGRQVGQQEEAANILLRQLQYRFGDVPSWANEEITKANLTDLEKWSLRLLDAKSLDEVFDS